MPAASDPLEFRVSLPRPIRVLLGACGLMAIVLPSWELRHAFIHPGLFSIFFGIIVAGGWTVGAMFLWAAFFGESQRWRVDHGFIEIERQNVFREITTSIRAADVEKIEIRRHDWDSQADTFSVALRLRDGREFDTPDGTVAFAQRNEQRIRIALGLPGAQSQV